MKEKQIKQVMNNRASTIRKQQRNYENRRKILTTPTVKSDAYRVLSTLYSVSGFGNPYLEFKQVEKGIFESDYLKNIQLKISNASFQDINGSVMEIIDLKTNTKVISKFLKSFKEILYIDKKDYENNKYKHFTKNLRLEDFQYDSIVSDFYPPNKYTVLQEFYLLAKSKTSEKEIFEFQFSFYNNKIILVEPIAEMYNSSHEGSDDIAKLLLDFDNMYFELYNVECDLYNNPYLNFF